MDLVVNHVLEALVVGGSDEDLTFHLSAREAVVHDLRGMRRGGGGVVFWVFWKGLGGYGGVLKMGYFGWNMGYFGWNMRYFGWNMKCFG